MLASEIVGTIVTQCRALTVMKRDKNFVWRRVDTASFDLKEMKVAIVGGTGGIGRAFSRFMASRGASVVVVGQTFRDSDVPGIEFIKADLSLMREAQRVAALFPAEDLDLLVFTTGIMAGPKREETTEGIERDIAVSYLSRLVIVREIGPRLGKNRPAAPMKPRVFIMGFPGTGQAGKLDDLNAEKSYGRWAVQMTTVAGNEMLVLDAAKRYPNATFFGLNPGFHQYQHPQQPLRRGHASIPFHRMDDRAPYPQRRNLHRASDATSRVSGSRRA